MFVGVVNFGHVPTLRFVGVKHFRSYYNQKLVILIWSSELASDLVEQKIRMLLLCNLGPPLSNLLKIKIMIQIE